MAPFLCLHSVAIFNFWDLFSIFLVYIRSPYNKFHRINRNPIWHCQINAFNKNGYRMETFCAGFLLCSLKYKSYIIHLLFRFYLFSKKNNWDKKYISLSESVEKWILKWFIASLLNERNFCLFLYSKWLNVLERA